MASGFKKPKGYKEPAGSDEIRAHQSDQAKRKAAGLPYGESQKRLQNLSNDIDDRHARSKGFGDYKEYKASPQFKKDSDKRWKTFQKNQKRGKRKAQIRSVKNTIRKAVGAQQITNVKGGMSPEAKKKIHNFWDDQGKKRSKAAPKSNARKIAGRVAKTAIRSAGPVGVAVSIFDFLKGKPAY